MTGSDIASVVAILEGLNVDAMGMNCGLGPHQMFSLAEQMLACCFIPVIIKLSGINQFKKVNEVTKEERKRLVGLIKAFPLTVKDTRGFNEAIITQGGVSVKDINPATMESKHIKGLFFAGEVIDVDALTGGYNLQIAWSTGWLAGQSAAGQRCL